MYPNFIWMRHCIQGYWLIFSHIHRHVIQGYWFIFSHIHRHVTRGEEGGLVCFGKKYPDSVHPWIKFFFQNVVLRVSRRKKCFPAGTFFLVFLKKCLSKCHSSKKPPLPWKISGCSPALRHYLSCRTLHIKCLTKFWIRLCLNNCSVFCTLTLCRTVFIQVYASIFKHIQH